MIVSVWGAIMPDLKGVLILVVAFLLAGAVCFGAEAVEERAGVLQLLEGYAETQKQLRSYVVKIQKTELNVVRPMDGAVKERSISYSEVRTDGGRFYVEERTPTDMLAENGAALAGDVVSTTWVWDGRVLYAYVRYSDAYAKAVGLRTAQGAMIIYNDAHGKQVRELAAQHRPGTLGQLLGVGDERIDGVLRGTQNVSVRDEMDGVSGSDCYIVDAIVWSRRQRYKYKVWMDPEHGYNVAKAIVWAQGGMQRSYANVIFRQVDDIWTPVSYEAQERRSEPLDGEEMLKSQVRVTNIVLNPDHKELGSFRPRPDDGAEVVIRESGGVERRGFHWRGGKVVDGKGNEFDCRPEKRR